MGSKIDSQMLQIHKKATEESSAGGKKISESEAIQLINRAEVLNNSYTSSCFGSSSKGRGNKYLKRLMEQQKQDFSPESQSMIKTYMKTGQIPNVGRIPGSPGGWPAPSSGLPGNAGSTIPMPTNPGASIPSMPGNPSRPTVPSMPTNPGASIPSMPTNPGASIPSMPNISRPTTPSMPTNPGVGTGGGGAAGSGRPGGGNASGGTPTTTYPGMPSTTIPGGSAPIINNPGRPGTSGSGTGAPSTGMPANPSTGGSPSGAPSSGRPTNPGTGASGSGAPSTGMPANPSTGGSGSGAPSSGRPTNPGAGGSGSGAPSTGTPANPSAGGSGASSPVTTNPATPGSGGTPAAGNPGGAASGNTEPTPPSTGTPGSVGAGSGVVGPHGKEILNFQATKSTWNCHWFPIQETKAGGDPINNLYAVGGPLDKLDMVTGGSAREYEYNKNRKAINAGHQFGWWGHCNNASESACVLQAPKHGVTMKAANGSEVSFTKNDIQGLLVKVSPSLVNKVDFKGERFNVASRDNPGDPKPELFLQVVQEWAQDGLPFVMDIDNKEQVWNFPYDKARIFESDQAPQGFDASGLSAGGAVKYYHIEMSGTGFDSKARTYECFVQRDSSGAVVASAWIKTPNTHNNPDFMWRPHPVGDLMNKATWQLRGNPSNPNVDPQVVYDIYMKSIA